jgi:hypothetical protein
MLFIIFYLCCGREMLRIEKEGKNGNYRKGFLLKKLNQLDPVLFEELNRKEKNLRYYKLLALTLQEKKMVSTNLFSKRKKKDLFINVFAAFIFLDFEILTRFKRFKSSYLYFSFCKRGKEKDSFSFSKELHKR